MYSWSDQRAKLHFRSRIWPPGRLLRTPVLEAPYHATARIENKQLGSCAVLVIIFFTDFLTNSLIESATLSTISRSLSLKVNSDVCIRSPENWYKRTATITVITSSGWMSFFQYETHWSHKIEQANWMSEKILALKLSSTTAKSAKIWVFQL